MKPLVASALATLLACSAPESTQAPKTAHGTIPILPRVATYVVRSPPSDSIRTLAYATAGVRSIKVEGQVPVPCQGHPPLIGQAEAVTGRLVLRIDIFVPAVCLRQLEIYSYTTVLDQLEAGSYPLEVRLHMAPPNPQRPASTRVVLLDTLAVL